MNANALPLLVALGPLTLALSHCSSESEGKTNTTGAATVDTTSTATGTNTVTATSAGPLTSSMSASVSSSSMSSATGVGGTTSTATTATVTATATGSTGMGGMTGAGGTTGTTTDSTGVGGSMSTGMGGMGGTSGGGDFTLTSSELEEGGEFLPKHTCEANGFDNDESPPLVWTNPPEGTMSFAITFIDVTLAPTSMNGYHYAIWDIPADVTELPGNLPSGATLTTPVMAKQYNPLSPSYLGPCPNFGGGGGETHTYEFTIYALPTATATLSNAMSVQAIDDDLKAAAIGSAVLSGVSSASP